LELVFKAGQLVADHRSTDPAKECV
jgi:hypothetical protein